MLLGAAYVVRVIAGRNRLSSSTPDLENPRPREVARLATPPRGPAAVLERPTPPTRPTRPPRPTRGALRGLLAAYVAELHQPRGKRPALRASRPCPAQYPARRESGSAAQEGGGGRGAAPPAVRAPWMQSGRAGGKVGVGNSGRQTVPCRAGRCPGGRYAAECRLRGPRIIPASPADPVSLTRLRQRGRQVRGLRELALVG